MDNLVVNKNCWIMETKPKVPVSHGGPSRVDFSFFPGRGELQISMCTEFSNIALNANAYNESTQKNHSVQAGIAYEHSKDTVAEGFWENPDINLIALA